MALVLASFVEVYYERYPRWTDTRWFMWRRWRKDQGAMVMRTRVKVHFLPRSWGLEWSIRRAHRMEKLRMMLARLAQTQRADWEHVVWTVIASPALASGPVRFTALDLRRLARLDGWISVEYSSGTAWGAARDGGQVRDTRAFNQLLSSHARTRHRASADVSHLVFLNDPDLDGIVEADDAVIELLAEAPDLAGSDLVLDVVGPPHPEFQDLQISSEAVGQLANAGCDLLVEVWPSDDDWKSWYL